MKWLLLFPVLCASCTVYQRQNFVYNANGQEDTLKVLVPKGYRKKNVETDSAGNPQLVYLYPNGSQLYFTRNAGARGSLLIDTTNNIPRPHVKGGIFYKGITKDKLFWRQVHLDSFHFGYRLVPRAYEIRFDSALNYVNLR